MLMVGGVLSSRWSCRRTVSGSVEDRIGLFSVVYDDGALKDMAA